MRHEEADVAYLAGLLEGEGYIYVRPNGRVTLGIEMCDEDVVRRVAEIVGDGNVLRRERGNG